ncbi:major tail protein [Mammaliicoccus sciuri]|uniref:major tail protein n=1 Tax=Mammaliicoccus sciuri TaxID=1296 RepID=UPI001E3BD5D8|nr:major tail protein [Mammaliicoccus sciuri]MCD8896594.1 hypothetical protein [Mammaliicoccus sciuri]
MAKQSKKVLTIGCEGFKFKVQKDKTGNSGELKDLTSLQEVGLEIEAEQGKVFADNETFEVLNSGVTGATVTGTFVDLTAEERAELLGVENKKGMRIYSKDTIPPYVSVSWKLRCSDGTFMHYGVTYGTFGIPSSSASTMEDGAPEQQNAQELEGNFIPRKNGEDKAVYAEMWSGEESFNENEFLEFIHGKSETTEPEETIPEG